MTPKERIKKKLEALADGDFTENAEKLLATLGYSSERTIPYSPGDPSEFLADSVATQSKTNLLENAKSLKLVFQLTNEEISDTHQASLFADSDVDESRVDSFYFVTAELKSGRYSRTKYAEMTREINKRYEKSPAVVLFLVDDLLTIAFIGRRQHQQEMERDVLGKVTLIKDIRLHNPHRAHLDILFELSLNECGRWIADKNKRKNFDGLLAAWLAKLDTEELNRQFYRKLFQWFERAKKECRFPDGESKVLSCEEHIIRLITRLMFIWFIKEKGIIAPELFDEQKIEKRLKNYDRNGGDSYYRAVLQNLFFATLNTEIDRRDFSKKTNTTHRDFSLYRYRAEMSDPDGLLKLFAQTPFINGGLFDCLDSFESKGEGGYRIDCFSDNPNHYGKLSIPNRLFFGEDGLLPLFGHYKFTVEENTPIEQEVALDPELLGKAFENLLAAYNPETRETARKQTGSYYTPRKVVDYMVDEALVACLAEKAQPEDGDPEFWDERLRYLLDYADAFDDADELFVEAERDSIIRAITEMKILDPAVGSGAFPMGALHKLTLALRRLDPQNKLWQELQKEKATQRAGEAFETADRQQRNEELREISDVFQHYKNSDFGRKLYLIQNNIFGVDIQPIACQIAKLRFFISLAIEQEPDPTVDNYGIKPLPNLETRFVTADTLPGLGKRMLTSDEARRLEHELYTNRERYFHATTRQSKRNCQKRDAELRGNLAEELTQIGMPAGDADKIAHWDPYDQNAVADWFDAEYMFGINDGFDVVISNPPYVQLQKKGGRLGKRYKGAGYETFAQTGDVYQLFYERGLRLARANQGLLAFITSNSWQRAKYGEKLRRFFSEQHNALQLIDMGKDVFENAIVDSNILLIRNGKAGRECRAVDMDTLPEQTFPPDKKRWVTIAPQGTEPWSILSPLEQGIKTKIGKLGTPLKDWDIQIYRGVTTGYNDAFIIDQAKRDELVAADPKSNEIIKPLLRGRDIQRWQANWAGLWLIYCRKGTQIKRYPAVYNHLSQHKEGLLNKAGTNEWYELQASSSDKVASLYKGEKLFWMDMSSKGRFCYADEEIYCNDKGFMLSGECLKYLCATMNSALITQVIKNTALTTGMGLLQWKKIYVERVPVPTLNKAEQRPFIQLVDKILAAKAEDPSADTSDWETEIDHLVYQLYDLTPEEIAAVEK